MAARNLSQYNNKSRYVSRYVKIIGWNDNCISYFMQNTDARKTLLIWNAVMKMITPYCLVRQKEEVQGEEEE